MTASARRLRAGRVVRLLLRNDARRPASWLALVGAGGAAWWLAAAPRGDGPWLAAAFASGAIAAVMAIGDVPRGTGVTAAEWAVARAAWPAVGCLVGAAVAGSVAAAGAIVACVAATTVAVLGHGRRETPAEPLAAALLAGGVAAGAALAVHVAWPAAPAPAVRLAAAGAWGAALCGGRWLRDALAEAGADGSAMGWSPRGPLGAATATFTMVAALVAAVAWLFLAPHLDWCYTLLAAGSFVAVAVPAAALGPGAAGERSRRALVATAGGPAGAWGAGPLRPGAGWMAWRAAAAPAAIFGWPLVVAAGVAGAARPALDRLGLAAALAAAAAAVAALTSLTLKAGGSRETALAASLASALVAAAACSGSHGMPRMGSLPRGNEVEQSSGFWKTPDRPQDDAGQPQPGGAVPWNRNPSRA